MASRLRVRNAEKEMLYT